MSGPDGSGSRRYGVDGLASPNPFGARLPDVYTGEEFAQRYVAAFDDVLAPVFAVLDCLPGYLDPALAPGDFLGWLGRWVAADLPDFDPLHPLDQHRELVAGAVQRHRESGTVRGLTRQLRLLGIEAQVTESGGSSWSASPNGPLPGSARAELVIRVAAGAGGPATVHLVEDLVQRTCPAHVPYRVEAAGG
ncbi:phage tail protein [Kitasatospora sp. NPDC052896]|uniref:phage tail protein n=1 Tax=Kitasatospora sp. NPDC052896 TaxID=3364061 RepID=UPI0037C85CB7